MYKRNPAFIAAQADVYDVQDELIDRYGDVPEEVQNLHTHRPYQGGSAAGLYTAAYGAGRGGAYSV